MTFGAEHDATHRLTYADVQRGVPLTLLVSAMDDDFGSDDCECVYVYTCECVRVHVCVRVC